MSLESPTSPFLDFDPLDVVAVTMIEEFGPATTRAHFARIRAQERSLDDGLPRGSLKAARAAAQQSLEVTKRVGARLIIDGDADYPGSLSALMNPPVTIWVIGDIRIVSDGTPAVSIVGTRNCTMYGERVTREIAAAFARLGATVVSGMALGIDAMAHRAALAAGGKTAAVLGTGIDLPYPASHRALHRQIGEQGLLVAESPPGTRAQLGCFPRRNRIIAALGSATIVVEAGVKSGARNTADWVRKMNRELAAVPGPIDAPSSVGSNLELRDGAHVIASVADALALLRLSETRTRGEAPESADEHKIWSALAQPAADFDVLCARTGLPARICFETVTALEMRGLVECSLTGELRRR